VMPPVTFRGGSKAIVITAVVAAAIATFTFPARAQQIVLLVNGTPITDLDIAHREKFLEMSNHKKPSRQEAINSLVDETLELREAARYSLEPTDADVQQAYDNVAENMGVDAQKLTQILSNGGASGDTLKHRLKAQIAWSTLVRGRFKVSLENRRQGRRGGTPTASTARRSSGRIRIRRAPDRFHRAARRARCRL
jgi:peptidyl-prolyl cis-trans isomerase SurA